MDNELEVLQLGRWLAMLLVLSISIQRLLLLIILGGGIMQSMQVGMWLFVA